MVWQFLHQLGIHKYREDHQAGVYSYCVCDICGKRNAFRIGACYSPLDEAWLDGGSSIERRDMIPPRGGTSGRKAQS